MSLDPGSIPVTIPQLAERLRAMGISVSAATLWRLVRRGELPATHVGGRVRTTVAAYLEALSPEPRR